MNIFNLPESTIKNKSIPKKAFYDYTNSKQQQLFVEDIDKIKWANSISTETINLPGKDIEEIQVFEIILKHKKIIEKLLHIIEKAIPYHIIFVIYFEDEVMLTTSQKHLNPINENQAVVDWMFKTEWFDKATFKYSLNLQGTLDKIYEDFCFQISNNTIKEKENLTTLIEREQKQKELNLKIAKLEAKMNNCKQFKKKLEMNQELHTLKEELAAYS